MSLGKIDKLEYLPGVEILKSYQSRINEQVKLTCFPFSKAFEIEIKIIGEKGRKQVEALEFLKSNTQKLTLKDAILKRTFSEEAKN